MDSREYDKINKSWFQNLIFNFYKFYWNKKLDRLVKPIKLKSLEP